MSQSVYREVVLCLPKHAILVNIANKNCSVVMLNADFSALSILHVPGILL